MASKKMTIQGTEIMGSNDIISFLEQCLAEDRHQFEKMVIAAFEWFNSIAESNETDIYRVYRYMWE